LFKIKSLQPLFFHIPTKVRMKLFFILILSGAFSACVISTGKTFSVPVIQGTGPDSFILELQEMYISLRPDNKRAADKSYLTPLYFPVPLSSSTKILRREDYFSIEIGIAPKNGDLIVDFRKVALKTNKGQPHNPKYLYGPQIYSFSEYPWRIDQDNSVCHELGDIGSLSTPITLKVQQWTCVVLTFDTSRLDPTEEFTLFIDGISDLNRTIYHVPLIQFHEKTRWEHKSIFTING
jgi:hypothetical protein